jgi:hypothetical protein
LSGGPIGSTVYLAAGKKHSAAKEMEPGPMRNSRIVRTLVVAGAAAALSILSLVSTVMAATGGGDFPRLR